MFDKVLQTAVLSLSANALFVFAGLAKQLLLAGALGVNEFGIYGAMVAFASLLLALTPFPAYLNVMINGFNDRTSFYFRRDIISSVYQEMLILGLIVIITVAFLLVLPSSGSKIRENAWPIALLFISQYAFACTDLVLRMQKAHRQLAIFMTFRNGPAILYLL